MRLTKRVVQDVVKEVVGNDVVPVVDRLKGRRDISEIKLAKELRGDINETRNKLYRLHNHNLVSFNKKKDKKNGLYIYYWTFNVKRVKELIGTQRSRKIEALKDRLERENQTQFFVCPENCIRLDFEQATNFGFRCPECGNLVLLDNNKEKIISIKKRIKELKTSI